MSRLCATNIESAEAPEPGPDQSQQPTVPAKVPGLLYTAFHLHVKPNLHERPPRSPIKHRRVARDHQRTIIPLAIPLHLHPRLATLPL